MSFWDSSRVDIKVKIINSIRRARYLQVTEMDWWLPSGTARTIHNFCHTCAVVFCNAPQQKSSLVHLACYQFLWCFLSCSLFNKKQLSADASLIDARVLYSYVLICKLFVCLLCIYTQFKHSHRGKSERGSYPKYGTIWFPLSYCCTFQPDATQWHLVCNFDLVSTCSPLSVCHWHGAGCKGNLEAGVPWDSYAFSN